MLGTLTAIWFAAGILLSIQVITQQGFRRSLARDLCAMRAIYNLPADTPDDVLRQAGRYYIWRKSNQLIPWGALMAFFIAATPALIFWGVAEYFLGPSRAIVAIASITFAAMAVTLLHVQVQKRRNRFRALNLDPELVEKLARKHLFR